jgi:hypothetical protein
MGSPISKARSNLASDETNSAPSEKAFTPKVQISPIKDSNSVRFTSLYDIQDKYLPSKEEVDQFKSTIGSKGDRSKSKYECEESIEELPQKLFTKSLTKPLQNERQYNTPIRHSYIMKRKTNPIIDISSSSSSSSASSLSSSSDKSKRFPKRSIVSKRKSLDICHSPPSSSMCSSDCNDDEDNVTEDEIYNWLDDFNSNTSAYSQKPTTSLHIEKTPDKNQSLTSSSPLYSTNSGNRITFTPPGWDSPLHETPSSLSAANFNHKEDRRRRLIVKDTHKVNWKNAQLPSKKPDVTKGDWLTNRLIVNNYIILHCLGSGSYGEVRLCKEKDTNTLYAVKVINKVVRGKFSSALDDLKTEVAIMKKLRHEHCVCLYEVMDDPRVNKLYLILEYMKRGDLMQIMGDKPMGDNDVWDIMRQIIRGLKYLHDNNIVHGDLKPQNLLVASDGTVKIGDFGLSKMIDENELQKEYVGTPAFMAPEVCDEVSFDGKIADLYSVGATTFYIRFGQPPFVGRNLTALYAKIRNSDVRFPFRAAKGLEEIIEGLMVKNPSYRLSMVHLMVAPWLQNRPGEKHGQKMKELLTTYERVQICNDDIYNSIQDLTQKTKEW